MKAFAFHLTLCVVFLLFSGLREACLAQDPPEIKSLVKLQVYSLMRDEREIMSHAKLEEVSGSALKKYVFYATMLVRADEKVTHGIMTDYPLYAKMIPYVESAKYNPKTQLLELEGGLWKYRLKSVLRFQELGPRWLKFTIISGHFTGMSGNIYFEPYGEKGTAVFIEGSHTAEAWPPKFIIEEGAKIVFGFTGNRMRSYIESQKRSSDHDAQNTGGNIPQPRSRFP